MRDVHAPYFYSVDPVVRWDHGRSSGWVVGAELSVDLARLCRETPMTDEMYERFSTIGLRVAKDYFSPPLLEDKRFYYHFVEDSMLLHYVQVPGNACDLGLGYHCQEKLITNEYGSLHGVEYTPHNVDTKDQANALLALWLEWARGVRARFKNELTP